MQGYNAKYKSTGGIYAWCVKKRGLSIIIHRCVSTNLNHPIWETQKMDVDLPWWSLLVRWWAGLVLPNTRTASPGGGWLHLRPSSQQSLIGGAIAVLMALEAVVVVFVAWWTLLSISPAFLDIFSLEHGCLVARWSCIVRFSWHLRWQSWRERALSHGSLWRPAPCYHLPFNLQATFNWSHFLCSSVYVWYVLCVLPFFSDLLLLLLDPPMLLLDPPCSFLTHSLTFLLFRLDRTMALNRNQRPTFAQFGKQIINSYPIM